ncbi:MAG: GerMN domain-containing protein [Lachnospiraceae bacterium]|nr:GerMN domain-containing protein [Lachnospiraceae bacterium]
MKTAKQILLLTGMVFFAAMLAGCEGNQEERSGYQIYYVNAEKTKTVSKGYDTQTEDTNDIIQEFIEELLEETGDPEYRRPIPEPVRLDTWKFEEGQLSLYFNSAYLEMDNIEEVLCRAAVARTLLQPKGVDCISFYVGDAPLVDNEGKPVGLMTEESFIENPGEQINTIQTANITLYFSNVEGDALVQEVQEIHYSSNISLEKLVMEQLLKGPKGEEGRSAIPDGTKLVNVSVLDGVCFVNLDEGFLNQNYEITEPVVIYSVVNSLTELTSVNKVQISVNGDSSRIYREKMDLSAMFERNLDYMDESAHSQERQMEEGEEHVVDASGGVDD